MHPLELTWDTPLMILCVVVIALVLHFLGFWVINRWISHVKKLPTRPKGSFGHKAAKALSGASGAAPERLVAHATAIAHMIKSIWTVTLVIVTVLTILSLLDIPLGAVLTSAGVGGVILAFGAQSLLKDYFAGISMILEDQFGVGDQITIGDISGTVEDVTMRITKVRDASGTIWYIRNGEILKVGNISQGYSTGIIDVPVAYNADVTQVTQILTQVVEEVAGDASLRAKLIEEPKLLGVESLTATTMTMRIMIKTGPNQQYGLVRDIRERALSALAAAGVPAPSIIPPPPIMPPAST